MEQRLDIIECFSFKDVRKKLHLTLDRYRDLLPASKDAKILIKPNLNANMNALTGNTTDLRILSALIQYLKGEGYGNIIIGEGTNSGYYRNKIGVISRLHVDELAKYYRVGVKDLNYAQPHEIGFSDGVKAHVAGECLDAELFINLPKLKTHFEVGMSVCLKNLMGCLIGQENKKKTHQDLAENILRINENLKPHLHIVDALVAMEGLGPTRGTPVQLNSVLVGTDPYLMDLACARIAEFDYKKIKTLYRAEKKGLVNGWHHRFVESLELEGVKRKFQPPHAGPLASFIHSPKRQKHFLKVRNTRLFSYLASTQWFGWLLFKTGLRQDVFLPDEMRCDKLLLIEENCDRCGVCADVCPLGLDLPGYLTNMDEHCISCMYCFCVCSENAIRFSGELGFFSEQLRQYDAIVKALYKQR